ncbi:metalloaminopeptidase APE1 [Ascoidea rubescens DSM 1968]|uniref:Vacuolar aminopeptidase n=1 Tax=Ascoidea rubescens DSM 1968 TaxID=1344418 RepID=A0A1D2VC21_9ASCO|nr:vacuolar aminopeptidase [Ascoidea rubescens DSM 1968]ODV59254.1 vacuolar aminopeptidase [Ascoidea rubescens DSM 1968]
MPSSPELYSSSNPVNSSSFSLNNISKFFPIVYDENYFESYSNSYISFTSENPTTYHVVKYFGSLLESHGFKYLSEKSNWGQLQSGFYYTTRNGTSFSAFSIGKGWKPENGVGLVGCHIDELTAKLKPNSIKPSVEGYELLGVSPYAGALSWLWWDRDLHIGGNVLVKSNNKDSKLGFSIESKLIKSPLPIAHIPSLAPHFGAPSQGPFNLETQAVPVIGYSSGDDEPATLEEKSAPLYGRHSLNLLRYIAKLAQVEVKDIVQLDLELYDGQKGTLGGLNKEFLFCPRIDDRICGFAAIHGLIEYVNKSKSIPAEGSFSMVTLYDNEEVGSLSRQGAKGGLSESVISRVIDSFIGPENNYPSSTSALRLTYANSIILSADVNHMLNPNFNNVYLDKHKALPNTGVCLSLDSNGHMATDVTGVVIIEQVAKLNDDKIQYFMIRNDSRSGGTIGPSISSQTGARTIDLGIPEISMHSIRPATGSKDVGLGVKFFGGFFTYWREVTDAIGDL